MTIPVFFCERTGDRNYYRSVKCECGHRISEQSSAEEYRARPWEAPEIHCHACNRLLQFDCRGYKEAFRRVDTGEIIYDLPPGAVYEHDGHSDDGEPHNWRQSEREDGKGYFITRRGPDGRVLACVCPDGHHWIIDARARNCTMKDDDEHWCWVRHGRPEDGTFHVDKSGVTCAAGAGSIDTGKWHGFLHHGQLREC